MFNFNVLIVVFLLIGFVSNGQSWRHDYNGPEELGDVNWNRSYSSVLSKAQIENKPIFILFQEVPGCATCRNFGNNLLTHPLIVEALETYFVPLAIYNNKSGPDEAILNKFKEPAWNNPVARIIDPVSEKDLVDRLNGRYDMEYLISFIINGIIESGQLVPDYLDLLYKQAHAVDLREIHLAMYCFWSGEKSLGALDGVIKTKAGYMNGKEVVKVKYDASVMSEEKLISYASKVNCADAVFTDDMREVRAARKYKIKTQSSGKFKPDDEPKYYLYKSIYRYLPMTYLQALKVNTAISSGLSPEGYLSPRQLELLGMITNSNKNLEDVIDKDFSSSWKLVLKNL